MIGSLGRRRNNRVSGCSRQIRCSFLRVYTFSGCVISPLNKASPFISYLMTRHRIGYRSLSLQTRLIAGQMSCLLRTGLMPKGQYRGNSLTSKATPIWESYRQRVETVKQACPRSRIDPVEWCQGLDLRSSCFGYKKATTNARWQSVSRAMLLGSNSNTTQCNQK